MLIESINSSFNVSRHFGKFVSFWSSIGTIRKKGENIDNVLDRGPSSVWVLDVG